MLYSALQVTHLKLTLFLFFSLRYTGRPFKKTAIHVHPPFLRPEVDLPLKVRDNGIQSQDGQKKVCSKQFHQLIQLSPPLSVSPH